VREICGRGKGKKKEEERSHIKWNLVASIALALGKPHALSKKETIKGKGTGLSCTGSHSSDGRE